MLFRLAALAAVTAVGVRAMVPLSVAAQSTGPELMVGTAVARAGGKVDVPVSFRSHGHQVATILFSLDIDAGRATVDGADKDGDDVPDAIRVGLPAIFQPMVSYDATDADGELDVLITAMQAPLPAMPDGTVLTVTLSAKAGASGNLGSAVTFALQPAASFGSTTGQSVTGRVVDARTVASPAAPQATAGSALGNSPSPVPGGPTVGSRATAVATPAGSSGGTGSSGTGRTDLPPMVAPAGSAGGNLAGSVPAATNGPGTPVDISPAGLGKAGTAPAGATSVPAAGNGVPLTSGTLPGATSMPGSPESDRPIVATVEVTTDGRVDDAASTANATGSPRTSGPWLVGYAILAILSVWWIWRRRRA